MLLGEASKCYNVVKNAIMTEPYEFQLIWKSTHKNSKINWRTCILKPAFNQVVHFFQIICWFNDSFNFIAGLKLGDIKTITTTINLISFTWQLSSNFFRPSKSIPNDFRWISPGGIHCQLYAHFSLPEPVLKKKFDKFDKLYPARWCQRYVSCVCKLCLYNVCILLLIIKICQLISMHEFGGLL